MKNVITVMKLDTLRLDEIQIFNALRAFEGWQELGLIEEAKGEVLSLDPALRRHPQCQYALAFADVVQGKFVEALAIVERLVNTHPDFIRGWVTLANTYRHMGDMERAINTAEVAIGIHPNCYMLHYNLACYHCVQGDNDKTYNCLSEALRVFEMGPDILIECVNQDPDLRSFVAGRQYESFVNLCLADCPYRV